MEKYLKQNIQAKPASPKSKKSSKSKPAPRQVDGFKKLATYQERNSRTATKMNDNPFEVLQFFFIVLVKRHQYSKFKFELSI
jgi:hypothetical protein